ncbi:unnamed protein product [Onchocerca flexuosa]|uniref:Uncharacterized protein n=1 Tax=Onchocerca flexuosa TaxID=387005 RepID=A0A183H5G3_9BILA|nr:unnamed protein product [Onchocerca flexuosa]
MPNLYGEEENFLEGREALASFRDKLWTNGKIYENVASEANNIQRPVQTALQPNDNHAKSFSLKAIATDFTGIINNGEVIPQNHTIVISSGAQLLASRRMEKNSTQCIALSAPSSGTADDSSRNSLIPSSADAEHPRSLCTAHINPTLYCGRNCQAMRYFPTPPDSTMKIHLFVRKKSSANLNTIKSPKKNVPKGIT